MKIKIDAPIDFIFTTRMDIRISEINYGGHMGNEAVLLLCHETRLRFLKTIECDEMNFYGPGIIMSDAAINYRREAFLGDQLEIKLTINDITLSGFDFIYLIENIESKKEIARAKTGIVFFDYNKRRPVRCPEKFLQTFKL